MTEAEPINLVTAPTGQVTLVFTDVQESTTLWEQYTQAMGQAIELHNQILRKHAAQWGGFEVKTAGDAFMLAFARPQNAAQFCIQAQLSLLDAPWPKEIIAAPEMLGSPGPAGAVLWRGLRVRMGVHTGTPQCVANPVTGRMDYFGPSVNRAARVAGAGQGGQILLSGATWSTIAKELATLGTSVAIELGNYALRGLSEPEQLVQILPKELAARQFAALKVQRATGAEGIPLAHDEDVAAVEQDEDFFALLHQDMGSLDANGVYHPGKPFVPAPATSAVGTAGTPGPVGAAPTRSVPEPEPVLELDWEAAGGKPKHMTARPEERGQKLWRRLHRREVLLGLVLVACIGAALGLARYAPDLPSEWLSRAKQSLSTVHIGAESPAGTVGRGASDSVELRQMRSGSNQVAPSDEVAAQQGESASRPLLYVNSDPADAEVVVHGKVIGRTPLVVLNNFGHGNASLTVKKAGYRPAKATFVGGKGGTVGVALVPFKP